MCRARGAALTAAAALTTLWLVTPSAAGAQEVRASQWALDAIRSPGGMVGDQVVAIVGSGVAVHPDLAGSVLPAVRCAGTAGRPERCEAAAVEEDAVATHAAGIVAARGSSGGALDGVAPGAAVAPVDLGPFDPSTADVAAAVRWATGRTQTVLLALPAGSEARILASSAVREAVAQALVAGTATVAPSPGPFGGRAVADVLQVVAVDRGEELTPGTLPAGDASAVAAPGGANARMAPDPGWDRDVVSTWVDGDYRARGGGVVAAAHVVGALARLRDGGLDAAGSLEALRATARPLGRSSTYGHGMVDVTAALTQFGVAEAVAPKPAVGNTASSLTTTTVASPVSTTSSPPTTAPAAPATPDLGRVIGSDEGAPGSLPYPSPNSEVALAEVGPDEPGQSTFTLANAAGASALVALAIGLRWLLHVRRVDHRPSLPSDTSEGALS